MAVVITPLLASMANAVPVFPPVMAKSLLSESPVTATVMTVVPTEALSATLAAWPAVISMLTSVTVMGKVVDAELPSALVAVTVTSHCVAVS